MPIHPHHGAKALEPEGVSEPAQEFVAAVFLADGFGDDGAELAHAAREPLRNAPSMERKIGAAAALSHDVLVWVCLVISRMLHVEQTGNKENRRGLLTPVSDQFITISFYNTSVMK